MNVNPSRQSPAEWEESAQLLPPTERDLPAGRHLFHKERLMARIQQDQHNEQNNQAAEGRRTAAAGAVRNRRFPMPRRAVLGTALAFTLVGAVAIGAAVVNSGGAGGGSGSGVATGPALTTQVGAATTKGVPQLLDQLSLAAADSTNPTVKPGQYVYIESKQADTHERTVDDKTTLVSNELHTRQTWMSADGVKGWLIDPSVNESPEGETLTLPDEQGNTPVPHLGGPSYDYLAKLTTDPDQLLKKIYKETKGQGNNPDQQAFTTIGDLLSESYPPAALYSALFKTAAKIPGVVVVQDSEDAAGRHGVAVARMDELSGERMEWIFDKKTHVYLGERTVQVRENGGDAGLIKPGTVTYTSAIMNRSIVDGMKQTPSKAS
nr:CU044_5270 family protein [Streptomyces sp. NBC_00857]